MQGYKTNLEGSHTTAHLVPWNFRFPPSLNMISAICTMVGVGSRSGLLQVAQLL